MPSGDPQARLAAIAKLFGANPRRRARRGDPSLRGHSPGVYTGLPKSANKSTLKPIHVTTFQSICRAHLRAGIAAAGTADSLCKLSSVGFPMVLATDWMLGLTKLTVTFSSPAGMGATYREMPK